MKIQSRPSSNPALCGETHGRVNDKDWQRAKDRVLLFIGMLGLPPVEGLEIALEAVKTAQKELARAANNHPITQAMQALRKLLAEGDPSNHGSLWPPADGIPFGPSLSRGSMVSQKKH
ncbi:MAG: hypothetical protein V1930_02895 [Pseudomonadota bacterium]